MFRESSLHLRAKPCLYHEYAVKNTFSLNT